LVLEGVTSKRMNIMVLWDMMTIELAKLRWFGHIVRIVDER